MAPINRKHPREVLNQLIEKASVQGYLTTDDLLDASPELGEDSERLSIIMLAVRHRGVEKVAWMFTFGAAAYNLVRMRNLRVLQAAG